MRAQSKTAASPRNPIKTLPSGMSGFSRPWRCPAAKSNPLISSADFTGMPPSLLPSMLEAREDPKLGLAAEMLRGRRTVRLRAWGTSMLPSLWPGDLLTIESAAPSEVIAGDIVLVLRDNRFFVHRIVEMRPGQDGFLWITRGDAMFHNDPPAPSELLGRVVGVRRANRSFVPSRRISLLDSALAWMLCRSSGLRKLSLKIRTASPQPGPACAWQRFRGACGALRGTSGISPSSASQP